MSAYPNTTPKTIAYDSPSGSTNIGKWIPPFQGVPNGFGFVGVLAEDCGSGRLQCHVCGGWYEQLPTHINAAHKINGEEYRAQFGLLANTALKSMRIRKCHSKTIQRLQRQGKMGLGNNLGKSPMVKGNKHAGNRKGKPKAIESANRFGVCDLQVAERILTLAQHLGRTPSLNELMDEYGSGMSPLIHNRYKSYITLVRSLGMVPLTSSYNPKFSREYFIIRGVEGVLGGKKLSARSILDQSEQRNVYRYFGSWKTWKSAVLERFSQDSKESLA